MYSFYVLTLAYRSLRITCAPANPPSYSFSLLVSYKSISKRVTKMTKIPLGISKISKLLYISFFIISKLIALGNIGIGQEIKNFHFRNGNRTGDTSRVYGHGSCPVICTLPSQKCNFQLLF